MQSFMQPRKPEPPDDWTPSEGWLAVAVVCILGLAGAAAVWIEALHG
jgi:hypothetical protein